MAKAKDRTGQRFGRLVVIRQAKRPEYSSCKHAMWECQCDCGNRAIVSCGALISGQTRSCGCLRKEIARINGCKRAAKRASAL